MQELTRREILETLNRQGISGISPPRVEAGTFGRYCELCMTALSRNRGATGSSSDYPAYRERSLSQRQEKGVAWDA